MCMCTELGVAVLDRNKQKIRQHVNLIVDIKISMA